MRTLVLAVAASILWWSAAYMVMMIAAIGPCGMGPDASCDVSMVPVWIALGGGVLGYAGLMTLILRRRRA